MRTDKDYTPATKPVKPQGRQSVAVAIESDGSAPDSPAIITAAGRGKLAQEILDVAFANGIKVREDCDLAELLVQLELDTPIPSEAILVVAEILAKVYEANETASFATSSRDKP
ncbi:MAG: EscU/YscU/HrcU family type III secretion system export apparatus switch protein [Alphaproteobacteria bacterium]|nr:EscU/YscU/HrcU family type III secretion system export apparatus switch protein [Alphaproteobacteria bacterium]